MGTERQTISAPVPARVKPIRPPFSAKNTGREAGELTHAETPFFEKGLPHLRMHNKAISPRHDENISSPEKAVLPVGNPTSTSAPPANWENAGKNDFSMRPDMERDRNSRIGSSAYTIQFKKNIPAPDSADEQEAVRVAAAVKMGEPVRSPNGSFAPCAAPESQPRGVAPGMVNRISQLIQTGGQPLDPEIRGEMETAFGLDFSAVRIHDDGSAAAAAGAVSAEAFTFGSHIVFSRHAYQPTTPGGKELLAHELVHVAQQSRAKATPVMQRDLELGSEMGPGNKVVSNATNLQQLVRDAWRIASFWDNIQSVIIITQSGSKVFTNRQQRRPEFSFSSVEGEKLAPIGAYLYMGYRRASLIVQPPDPNAPVLPIATQIPYSEFSERQMGMVDPQTNAIDIMEAFGGQSAASLPGSCFPAILVVRNLPNSSSGQSGMEPWAEDQVRRLRQALDGEAPSGGESQSTESAPHPMRDHENRPDRIVPWRRQDGKQFINLWVGGQNRREGGRVTSVELREGETEASLQDRVRDAMENLRRQLNEEAIDKEQALTNGFYTPEWAFLGGADSTGEEPNQPAVRVTMRGPEKLPRNATGTYNISLHYEDYYPDTLGQVAEHMRGANFLWQVFNITPLITRIRQQQAEALGLRLRQLQEGLPVTPLAESADELALERQGRMNGTDENVVGFFDADWRDAGRRYDNISEDASQALADLRRPYTSENEESDNSIIDQVINGFNLAALPIQGILSLGGFVFRLFGTVFSANPGDEKEIPFPDTNGFYMVRCVVQPRPGGPDDELRRAPSYAVKILELKNPDERSQQELRDQEATLQATILERLILFRNAPSVEIRAQIRLQLEAKVQEAAQNNRQFLENLIQLRREELETNPAEPIRQIIQEEIEILSAGMGRNAGLISDILRTQVAIQQQQLEGIRRTGNIYSLRQAERQLEMLRRRLGTATAREAEMEASGVAIMRPQAAFVNEADGQVYPLLIELGQIGHHSSSYGYVVRLSDVTSTDSDNHSGRAPTREMAARRAINQYAGHFPYGRGFLTITFPRGNAYGIIDPITVRCNPRDTALAAERLNELLQLLALVGLLLPGINVYVGMAAAVVSISRIMNRISNHSFAWDINAVTDILNILGTVAGGAQRIAGSRIVVARRFFAIVPESEVYATWVARLNRYHSIAAFADRSISAVSHFIGTLDVVNQYLEISRELAAGNISAAEARRRRALLIMQNMHSQFMYFGGPHISEASQARRERARAADSAGNEAAPRHEDESSVSHTPRPQGDAPTRQGTPEERVQAFLANRENRRALFDGNEGALQQLLIAHGNWHNLIEYFGRPGHPDQEMHLYLIGELGAYRDRIVAELGVRFGLTLSSGHASVEAASDVDLATTGRNAGRNMLAAEGYMRNRFGDDWSELLRMNFYTEAERAFLYDEVQHLMTEAQFSQLQQRMTSVAEMLNFAKMLQHAGDHAESRQRVEALMAHLDAETKIRIGHYAAETPAEAASRLQVLLHDIDNLSARFDSLRHLQGNVLPEMGTLPVSLPPHIRDQINRAITPDELRIAIASAISEMQMEANFRTTEAYISPGANRQTVRSVGVRGHEAYQSALGNLEMMEHMLHSTGGDLGRALVEYEIHKYVNRFIIAMTLSGISPSAFMLQYLQTSQHIYRNNRNMLQSINRHDLEFITAMHRQFVVEAAEILPQMQNHAMQNSGEWDPATSPSFYFTENRQTGNLELGGIPTVPHRTIQSSPRPAQETIGSLFGTEGPLERIQHVPIHRTEEPGDATRIRFDENGSMRIEMARSSGMEQLRQHVDFLATVQKIETGRWAITRFLERIGERLGVIPPRGSRGREARLEVQKLTRIQRAMQGQLIQLDLMIARINDWNSLADLFANRADLEARIEEIELQLFENSLLMNSRDPGRGYVASDDSTRRSDRPTQPIPAVRRSERPTDPVPRPSRDETPTLPPPRQDSRITEEMPVARPAQSLTEAHRQADTIPPPAAGPRVIQQMPPAARALLAQPTAAEAQRFLQELPELLALAQRLPQVEAQGLPASWTREPLALSGGEDVFIFRGFASRAQQYSAQVVRVDADVNAGGILSRNYDAAQDAIFNWVGRVPTRSGPEMGGVVRIRIPGEIWNLLVQTNSLSERSYPGFSRSLSSTEIRVNSQDAARLINRLEKVILPPDPDFDFERQY